jgi:hypothetical protein
VGRVGAAGFAGGVAGVRVCGPAGALCDAEGGEEPAGRSNLRDALPSVTALAMLIMCPHLRHFIRTDRPATLSSAIWYLALQLGQRNFIQPIAGTGRARAARE